MIVATWNVNSVKIRVENTLAWLKERDPDIVCLQEIKCVDEAFPREAFESAGYNVATHGQKTYNGVAILSKLPLEDVTSRLPGDETDEQARYLEAVVSAATGAVRVASLYLPNGNPLGTEKFGYKLGWMDRLIRHARDRLALEEPFLLCGDYNVIPMPEDAKNPKDWVNDALFQPESRGRLRRAGGARLHRCACAPATTPPGSTRSGTTRPAPGSGTTASASTTSCSRPRRPTGW
jgi:exodeoxyribonuclease-3